MSFEKQQRILKVRSPVKPVVAPFELEILMRYAVFDEILMQCPILIDQFIVGSAIESQGRERFPTAGCQVRNFQFSFGNRSIFTKRFFDEKPEL
jgi:hypothetical protein